jgi:hypothetical protein
MRVLRTRLNWASCPIAATKVRRLGNPKGKLFGAALFGYFLLL